MKYDFSQNHFALFGLEPAFRIDTVALDQAYRDIQTQVHPDRFADASEAERRMSMQWSTHANEAYQTLKKPASRARYLLQLHGVDALEESNTAMPAEFLVSQMEWREAIGDAKAARDGAALQRLERELKADVGMLLERLAGQLDDASDDAGAALCVRKLKFMEKLIMEVQDASEALEQ